jgi:hypothetical protein
MGCLKVHTETMMSDFKVVPSTGRTTAILLETVTNRRESITWINGTQLPDESRVFTNVVSGDYLELTITVPLHLADVRFQTVEK